MEAEMFETIHVGLNGWGDVVLYCDGCKETFANKVQTKTLKEINDLAENHKCDKVLAAL
jgi:hypothetical protein